MGDKKILKRVRIDNSNMDVLTKLAEKSNLPLSEYLDYLINKAIFQEYQQSKQVNPLYVWKS